jgi:hypothetical protein
MKRFFLITCLLLSAMLAQPVMAAGSNAGEGRWVNPISDVCWKCLFPMTLGSIRWRPVRNRTQPILHHPSRFARSVFSIVSGWLLDSGNRWP